MIGEILRLGAKPRESAAWEKIEVQVPFSRFPGTIRPTPRRNSAVDAIPPQRPQSLPNGDCRGRPDRTNPAGEPAGDREARQRSHALIDPTYIQRISVHGIRRLSSPARSARMLGVAAAAMILLGPLHASGAMAMEFTDVEKQSKEFIAYNTSIKLTAQQEQIKKEALSVIPAPCCANRSAYTCCCPCNMAKTWWGLSKHLIAERGQGVQEVRNAVKQWIAFINPDGFSGDSCYRGGCGRAFSDNGCGGMDEKKIVF